MLRNLSEKWSVTVQKMQQKKSLSIFIVFYVFVRKIVATGNII